MVSASAEAPESSGLLAKLGRVIKEKAQADLDRIFKARVREGGRIARGLLH